MEFFSSELFFLESLIVITILCFGRDRCSPMVAEEQHGLLIKKHLVLCYFKKENHKFSLTH